MRFVMVCGLLTTVGAVLVGCGGSQVPVDCPEPTPVAEEVIELDMTKTLDGVADIEAAVARVTEALKAQGFGVVSDMDVQAIMKAKLDEEMRPYRILGACNPKLAFRALGHDEVAGLLLPCKAVVYQDENGAFAVTLGRPTAVFGLLNDPATDPLADEVEQKLTAVFESL